MTTKLPDYETTIARLSESAAEKLDGGLYGVLFTTQIRRRLMRLWLDAIAKVASQTMSPEEVKAIVQHYTCAHCAKFMERVGHLVVENGSETKSFYWDASAIDDPFFKQVVTIMATNVEESAITGIFNDKGAYATYTATTTDDEERVWNHHYINPSILLNRHPGRKSIFNVGEYRRQFAKLSTLVRISGEVNFVTVARVIQLFRTKKLHSINNAIKTAENFGALLGTITGLNMANEGKSTYRITTDVENACWMFAARHPDLLSLRTSSLGRLLLGCSVPDNDDVAMAEWKAATNPLNYRRTSAPATEYQVTNTLKYLEENGWLPSFDQREAAEAEIPVHWVAERKWAPVVEDKGSAQASFSDFAKKSKEPTKPVDLGEMDMGYVFNNILPSITSMAFDMTRIGCKPMLINAMVDPTAKPIFKWDKEGDRRTLTPWRYDTVFRCADQIVDNSIKHDDLVLVPVLSIGSSASIGFHAPSADPVLCIFLHGLNYSYPGRPALFADSVKGELYDHRRAIEDYCASTTVPRCETQRALGLTLTPRNPVNHSPFLMTAHAVLNDEGAKLYGGREVTFTFDVNGYLDRPVLKMNEVIYDRTPKVEEPTPPEEPPAPSEPTTVSLV